MPSDPDLLRDTDSDRQKLISVLTQFHLTAAEFDRMRVLTYEQQIAGCSPDQLKMLYLILLKPGLSLRARVRLCPPWPKGTPYAGAAPHPYMLGRIRQRLLDAAESALTQTPGQRNQPPVPEEPYDPVAEKRKIRAMIDKMYNLPPRPQK